MRPRSTTFLNTLLFSLVFAGLVHSSYAQEEVVEGEELDNVTITEDEARRIMKGLFDLPRLTHSLAIGKIARDELLVAYADGFMQRNHIEVLTIGYIDSDEFWPKVFRDQRLAKITKSDNDNLLAAKIIFLPLETDGTITGYNCTLELTGKTQQVYELLAVSKDDIDLIATETSQQQLGSTAYANPTEAKETVVSALIAALQRVEETSGLEKEAIAADSSIEGIQKAIIGEALQNAKENIEAWQKASEANDEEGMKELYECFYGRETDADALMDNINRHLANLTNLFQRIESSTTPPTVLRSAGLTRLGKPLPHFSNLPGDIQSQIVEMICQYIVEGVELRQKIHPPFTAHLSDNYYLPDQSIKTFGDGDTIRVFFYMSGITLGIVDSLSQVVSLSVEDFLDIEVQAWGSEFILNIDGLQENETSGFRVNINEIDTLNLFFEKVPFPSDAPVFDISEDDIEGIADTCSDWSAENDKDYTCNFCVRDAFYNITGLTILYPGSPNNSCVCCDPQENNLTGGLVQGNGTANTIESTLSNDSSGLAQYFEGIPDMENEDYPDFVQMQIDANQGQLIVGVKSANIGHVVLLLPEDLWEADSENDVSRALTLNDGSPIDRPIALECGQAENKRAQPVRWSTSGLKSVKWFRYMGL